MRILSKIADYYDHVPYLYGVPDEDPRQVTYVRNRHDYKINVDVDLANRLPSSPRISDDSLAELKARKLIPQRDEDSVTSGLLFVCGRVFPAMQLGPSGYIQILPADLFKRFYGGASALISDATGTATIAERVEAHKKALRQRKEVFVPKLPEVLPAAIEFAKLCHKSPVFFVNPRYYDYHLQCYWHKVFDGVLLAGSGITEYLPPEQMYQEVEYFLTNLVNESPDVQPAGKPPQTDTEKVAAHGFDTKKSFRHRV